MAELAEVEIVLKEVGGRSHSINPNDKTYRPHFLVDKDGEMLGVQFKSGRKNVTPGKRVRAVVRLLYHPNVSYRALVRGRVFSILEGSHVVGEGKVIRRFSE